MNLEDQLFPERGADRIGNRLRQLWAVRTIGLPPWVLLTQLFIGLGWLRAAAEKTIDPSWWFGWPVEAFIDEHGATTLGWYRPIIDRIVEPNAPLIAIVVVVLQFGAAFSLLSGRRVGCGLAAGIFLNLNFVAIGAVNPSAFYLVIQLALVLWLTERVRHRVAVRRCLGLTRLAVLILAVISLPFVSTMHPQEVIDDPAIMLITLAGLLMLCTHLTTRAPVGEAPLPLSLENAMPDPPQELAMSGSANR